MEQENFTPPQAPQPSLNQDVPKATNKKVYLGILLGILFVGLIASGYFVYQNYFSVPLQVSEDKSPINSTPKSEEVTSGNENDFSKNLGISFILPEVFSYKLDKSYLGFEYINILYPEKDQVRGGVENGVVCPHGGCAVIRHGSSLFPNLYITSNADVKKYIEDHKKIDQYDRSLVVKEWEKSGVKYLQIYSDKYRFQDIVFLESQSPQNFIAVLIPSSRVYNKNEDPKDENYKKTIDLVNSIKITGSSTYLRPTNPLVVYRNTKLGIQFEYPSEWGVLEESVERGCYEAQEKITEQDPCQHVDLLFMDLEWPVNLLSAYSVLFSQHGVGRGGYWGDFAGSIKDEDFVKNYCNDKDKNKCRVYKNANGILVARSIEDVGYGEGEAVLYYIKSSHPVFFGLVLSTDRFQNVGIPNLEEKIDRLVDSLRFIQ